jgi:hypothetical protein
MRRLAMKSALAVSVIIVPFFVLEAGLALAQEKFRWSIKETVAYVKREGVEVGDAKGHYAGMNQFEGTFTAATPTILEGAQVTGVSSFDAIQRNGSARGYEKIVKGPNSCITRYEMEIRPYTPPDGSPSARWEGTFTFIKGTGEIEGIQGGGTFRAAYFAKSLSATEGEGEYWIEK